jgi:phosphatidylglycerophosphate synthase
MTRADHGSATTPVVLLVAPVGLPAGAVELVGERAVAESGELMAPVGPEGLGRALRSAPEARSVVVVDAGWLTVATVYGDLVADPREGAAVLRRPDGALLGVRVPAAAADHLAAGLAGAQAVGPADDGAVEDALAVLGEQLRARGPVRDVGSGDFPVQRIGPDLRGAVASVDAADEAALRLRRASRSDDGFLSHFLVRPLSRQLTKRVVRGTRLTPARITSVSLALGLGSAAAYTGGSRGWLLAGSVLLLLSLVVDCVDGEVARYTRTFSALGGWLDVASDRVKEYAVYAGLAVGASAASGRDLWGLAVAAMAVLVVRHAVDFGFAAGAGQAEDPSTSSVARLSASTSRRPALMWAKRAVILPVGERTLVLIVLVPLAGPAAALWVLLAWGVVAGAYTTAGRLGRAWRTDRSTRTRQTVARVAAQCDSLPLPAALLGASGTWGWLVPAACRVVETGGAAALVWWAAGRQLLPAVFALLGVAAFRGYDVVYRQRLADAVTPGDRLAWSGWPVRLAAVGLLAVGVSAGLAVSTASAVLWAFAGVLGLAAVLASARWWRALPAGWVRG